MSIWKTNPLTIPSFSFPAATEAAETFSFLDDELEHVNGKARRGTSKSRSWSSGHRMGRMNKILLVLIIFSGVLLIFYANINYLFRDTQSDPSSTASQNGRLLLLMDDEPAAAAPNLPPNAQHLAMAGIGELEGRGREKRPRTTYNLFVIYTKETEVLQKKYELMLKSLFKYTASIAIHLTVITDAKSVHNAEAIARAQMAHYDRRADISLLDVEDCVDKISDIVQAMMPYFSSHPGKGSEGILLN